MITGMLKCEVCGSKTAMPVPDPEQDDLVVRCIDHTPKEIEKRNCEACGTIFVPIHNQNAVCSHACHVGHYGIDCNCDECQGTGYPTQKTCRLCMGRNAVRDGLCDSCDKDTNDPKPQWECQVCETIFDKEPWSACPICRAELKLVVRRDN